MDHKRILLSERETTRFRLCNIPEKASLWRRQTVQWFRWGASSGDAGFLGQRNSSGGYLTLCLSKPQDFPAQTLSLTVCKESYLGGQETPRMACRLWPGNLPEGGKATVAELAALGL